MPFDAASYQHSVAHDFAYAPTPSVEIAIAALGLAGESAELFDKIRHGANTVAIVGEMGDVCWYIARLCSLSGTEFATLTEAAQDAAAPHSASVAILELMAAAGAMAERCKKALRDHDGSLSPDRAAVKAALQTATSALSALTVHYGVHLQLVANANLDKLARRRQTGTLQGDGDNRGDAPLAGPATTRHCVADGTGQLALFASGA